MVLPSGNPFKCHEEVLYLQPVIAPRRFDIFSPDWGMLRRSRCIQIFLNNDLRFTQDHSSSYTLHTQSLTTLSGAQSYYEQLDSIVISCLERKVYKKVAWGSNLQEHCSLLYSYRHYYYRPIDIIFRNNADLVHVDASMMSMPQDYGVKVN